MLNGSCETVFLPVMYCPLWKISISVIIFPVKTQFRNLEAVKDVSLIQITILILYDLILRILLGSTMYLTPSKYIRSRCWSITSGQAFNKLPSSRSTIHSHFCDIAIKIVVEIVAKWLANATTDQDRHFSLHTITTINWCPAWYIRRFLDATIISYKVACVTICYASWRIHVLYPED